MDIENLLKENNLKVTKHRRLILQKLEEANEPVTAEMISCSIKNSPDEMDLSTIYRNLNALVEKNILLKNSTTDGTSYFQLNKHNHKHFITCIKCHKKFVIENCPLDSLEKKLAKETGFIIKGHSIEFTGICPDCQKK